jgi:hypothetical protein
MTHWLQPLLESILDRLDPTDSFGLKDQPPSSGAPLNLTEREAGRWQHAVRSIDPPCDAADLFRSHLEMADGNL